MPKNLTPNIVTALKQFNSDYGTGWSFGTNWTNVESSFETFVNKYLFPKLNETTMINVNLGNRFDWLAKETDFVGQYSEEYVILDTVPVNMNLSKNAELMLKRNYPKMATKLYGAGILKKTKFTLNDNDVRLNFLTLADGIKYAMAVYLKRISDINVVEEQEIKAMLIEYALEHVNDYREVASKDDLFNEVFNAILNIQNNSSKYNEANKASGGQIGRYTTITRLENVAILTNDRMKTFLLDTKLANTFQVAGLDLSSKIISFDDLGGVYKITDDVTLSAESIEVLDAFGDYQSEVGDILEEGTVLTFDITTLDDFNDKYEEVKPHDEMFAYIFDINKLRYKRNTKDMLKPPFYNGEFDETTYWLHYYSSKSVSPFYNSILVGGRE